jgi:hypothetical protein
MESMDKRLSLISKIRSLEEDAPDDPLPVVSLEDFFEGNTDEGSIGCNLIPHPGIYFFHNTLIMVRNHPRVQTVLIEIFEVDETFETWPFSERVYVYTALPEEEIAQMMKPLKYDELEHDFFKGRPLSAVSPQSSMNVYAFWWD